MPAPETRSRPRRCCPCSCLRKSELPAEAPSAAELAERAAQQSIELFPVGRCYHSGRAIRDGLVIGYAALTEHAFESGVTALGDFLERSLSS
jgi:DNA-binding transcriptional MocR family regulator